MAPNRAVKKKASMSHGVNFLLDWPVTLGRRDREALACPTLTRHCSALIGICKQRERLRDNVCGGAVDNASPQVRKSTTVEEGGQFPACVGRGRDYWPTSHLH